MSVKLKNQEEKRGIPAYDMKDGQIGVIVNSVDNNGIRRIVQKYGRNLVSIGLKSPMSFIIMERSEDLRVEILPNGTELIIENNQ